MANPFLDGIDTDNKKSNPFLEASTAATSNPFLLEEKAPASQFEIQEPNIEAPKFYNEGLASQSGQTNSFFDKVSEVFMAPYKLIGKNIAAPIQQAMVNTAQSLTAGVQKDLATKFGEVVSDPKSKELFKNIGDFFNDPNVSGYAYIHGREDAIKNLELTNFLMTRSGGFYAKLASDIANTSNNIMMARAVAEQEGAAKFAAKGGGFMAQGVMEMANPVTMKKILEGSGKVLDVLSYVSTQKPLEYVHKKFPIVDTVSYSPQIQALAAASNGDFDKAHEMVYAGVFFDTLATAGLGFLAGWGLGRHLPNKLAQMLTPVEKATILKGKSIDDLKFLDDELRRYGQARGTINSKVQPQVSESAYFAEGQITPSPMLLQDEVVNKGNVFKINTTADGTHSLERVRKATAADTAVDLLRNDDFVKNPEKYLEGAKDVDDILGLPGDHNTPMVPAKKSGMLTKAQTIMLSPKNSAIGPLWYVAQDFNLTRNKLKNVMDEMVLPFSHLEGTELATKVGIIADGAEGANLLLQNLEPEGIQLLKTVRQFFDFGAEATQIPQEKRMTSYMYHTWAEGQKALGIKQIADEKSYLSNFFGPTKERTGVEGYELDVIKVMKKYSEQAADYAAKKQHLPQFREEITRLYRKDQDLGKLGLRWSKNFFNVLDPNDPIKPAFNRVKNMLVTGMLANNLSFTLQNIASGPILGFVVGGKRYMEGWGMMSEMLGKAERSKFLSKVAKDSGIFNEYFDDYQPGKSFVESWTKNLPEGNAVKRGIQAVNREAEASISASEVPNRLPLYMGEYMWVHDRMTAIKSMRGAKLHKTEEILRARKIDPYGDVDRQAHRWAISQVTNAHTDMSISGANALYSNPGISLLGLFTKYPANMLEFYGRIMIRGARALKYLVKNPSRTFMDPDLQSAVRLMTAEATLFGISAMTPYNLLDISGFGLLGLKSPVAISTYKRLLDGINKENFENDLTARKAIGNAFTVTGMPFAWAYNKTVDLLNQRYYNRNRQDGSWDIYDVRSGKKVIRDVPVSQYLLNLTTPIKDDNIQNFYETLRKAKAQDSINRRINDFVNQSRVREQEVSDEIRSDKNEGRRRSKSYRQFMKGTMSYEDMKVRLKEIGNE